MTTVATKFQLDQPVRAKLGETWYEGTVIYVTPADKLERTILDEHGKRATVPGPQTYHVEIPRVGTYDFDEPDVAPLTPATAPAPTPANPAAAPLVAAESVPRPGPTA